MYALIVALYILYSSIGNVLSSVENPAKVTSRIEARVIVFNIDIPITNGYPVRIYTSLLAVKLVMLVMVFE